MEGLLKMECIECNTEMELVESYKFGRHEREFWQCSKCGEHEIKKGKLIPNTIGRRY